MSNINIGVIGFSDWDPGCLRAFSQLRDAQVTAGLPGNQGLRPGTCYLYELNNDKRAAHSRVVPRQG